MPASTPKPIFELPPGSREIVTCESWDNKPEGAMVTVGNDRIGHYSVYVKGITGRFALGIQQVFGDHVRIRSMPMHGEYEVIAPAAPSVSPKQTWHVLHMIDRDGASLDSYESEAKARYRYDKIVAAGFNPSFENVFLIHGEIVAER